MLLTHYGIREWGLASVIALGVAAIIVWLGWWWLLCIPVLGWIAVAGFFRDPLFRRPASEDPRMLLSPADGRVTAVERLESHEVTGEEPAMLVRIFLSVLDVHINRAPCDGVVESRTHRPGKYLDARSEESARVNESNLVILKCKDNEPVGIRQVSGAIARRIVCPITIGEKLNRAQRFGMIKFGSTTELIIPDREGVSAQVAVGDRVRGGVTVLIRIP